MCGNRIISIFMNDFLLLLMSISFLVCLSFPSSADALLQVGTNAPDFTLKDTEGKTVGLSQYTKQKAVVLVFWSSWSANAPKALKRLEAFNKKYAGKGIQVIGINADKQTMSADDIEKLRKLSREWEITFPLLVDSALRTFHEYSIVALPSTVIITEGKIAYELPGLPLVKTEEMFDYLLMLAGEQPRTKIEPLYHPQHDAVAEVGLARGFVSKRRYEMAYPLFKKAIERDPRFIPAYTEMAKLYETEDRYAEAEDILKKALAADPESVVAASELGYLQARTGKLKDSVELLERTAKKNSYTPSHYYLAFALGKIGRLNEAHDAFQEALLLNPYDPMIYALRAEIYESGNKFKEASSDYRKALELMLKFAF